MRKIYFFVISLIILVGIISVATAVSYDKPEKITFIHYKGGKIKVVDAQGKPTTNTCYKLLGAKLPDTTSYFINPTNPNGLSESFVTNAIYSGSEEWDKYTNKELFNNIYTIDYSANWDDVSPDRRMEYSFGSYPQSGVIAVTNIWMARSGKQKIIIDFDVLFNTYFNWGDATANPSLMDLQNIATHETGHGLGLADLYNGCTAETMYGYSSEGDVDKRTLNSGDIAGIRNLYGL